MKTELTGLCQRDEEHQREWREFFEKCFDKNGNYIEKNAEELINTFKERRKGEKEKSNQKQQKVCSTNNDVRTEAFGNS